MKYLFVLAVLLACGPALATGGATKAGTEPVDGATSAAPSLDITTLDGRRFDLAAERGKWVIINYWATWCGPCIEEMPALSDFAASRDDVTVIGLDYEDQPRERIEAFLQKHPVHYAIAMVDPVNPPTGLAEPQVLPTTFLVAPDGQLAKTFVGPLDMQKLTELVDKSGGTP